MKTQTPIVRFGMALWRPIAIRSLLIGIAILMLFAAAGTSYAYTISPPQVRKPVFEHLHFRMQIIVDGKALNFADKQFQQGYAGDNCNVALTESPIHFHDNKDQFVHIHWKEMTGGMVLKYYGWNYIGGTDGLLGYRFDAMPNIVTVPTHGKQLPGEPKRQSFYIYTGDEQGYQQRNFDTFLQHNLETFFNKKSSVQAEPAALLNRLFPKASAHNGVIHGSSAESAEHDHEDKLKRLNNLIGNVVIFSQKEAPTDDIVKARFADLEPMSESTCGG